MLLSRIFAKIKAPSLQTLAVAVVLGIACLALLIEWWAVVSSAPMP